MCVWGGGGGGEGKAALHLMRPRGACCGPQQCTAPAAAHLSTSVTSKPPRAASLMASAVPAKPAPITSTRGRRLGSCGCGGGGDAARAAGAASMLPGSGEVWLRGAPVRGCGSLRTPGEPAGDLPAISDWPFRGLPRPVRAESS